MTWDASIAALHDALFAVYAQSLILIDSTGNETACRGTIDTSPTDLYADQMHIGERRYTGLLDWPDESTLPEQGDTLTTAAGIEYRIDVAPLPDGTGALKLILRRLD